MPAIRTPRLDRELTVLLYGSWVLAGLIGAGVGYGALRVYRRFVR